MQRPFEKIFPYFLLLLAAVGIGLNLYATTWGAALSDDLFDYIKPARDILAGLPYQLSSHYPPALPFLLAAIGRLTGLDPLQGIRFLNAFCFGLNIYLAGLLVSKASKSLWIGTAAAIFVLLAQPAFEVHAWAMSEALFISLMLASFLVAGQYLETRRIGWFALSVVLASLTALTRYAGLALIAAICLVFLIYPGRSWKRRALDAFAFGSLATGLFALYPLSLSSVSSEFSSVGGLRFGPIGADDWTELLYNSLLWLMPGRLARGQETLVAEIIGALLIVGLLLAVILNNNAFLAWICQILASPLTLLVLFFILFSLYILYQASQADRYRSPFDFRLLAPTHIAILLLAFTLTALAWGKLGRILRAGLVILFIFLFGLYVQRTSATVNLYHQEGMGFASRYWHDSELLDFIASTSPQTTLVTTAPFGVYFATNRMTELFTAYTPDQLANHLDENGGYFILVELMPIELYGQNAQDYLSKLKKVRELSNAVIYQAP